MYDDLTDDEKSRNIYLKFKSVWETYKKRKGLPLMNSLFVAFKSKLIKFSIFINIILHFKLTSYFAYFLH